AMRQQYAAAGCMVRADRPLIRRFWGRPYFNISLFNEAAYTLYGATPEMQAAQLGGMVPPGVTQPATPSLWQRLRSLRNILRFIGMANRTQKAAAQQFAEVQQRWRAEVQRVPHLDRAALVQTIERYAAVGQPFLLFHLQLTAAMSGNFSALREMVAQVVG